MKRELLSINIRKKIYNCGVLCTMEVFFRYKRIKGNIEIETTVELSEDMLKDLIIKEVV